MDALFPRCTGLDVHKANVVVCVRVVGPTGKLEKLGHQVFLTSGIDVG
jgi:hypothetical protein